MPVTVTPRLLASKVPAVLVKVPVTLNALVDNCTFAVPVPVLLTTKFLNVLVLLLTVWVTLFALPLNVTVELPALKDPAIALQLPLSDIIDAPVLVTALLTLKVIPLVIQPPVELVSVVALIVTAPLPDTLDDPLTDRLYVPIDNVPLVTLRLPVTLTLLAVSVMPPPAIVNPPLNCWLALDGLYVPALIEVNPLVTVTPSPLASKVPAALVNVPPTVIALIDNWTDAVPVPVLLMMILLKVFVLLLTV